MGLLVYITVTYGQDYNFKPGEVIKLFVFLKPSALSNMAKPRYTDLFMNLVE